MDEAKRFMRYVLPGLVTVTAILVFLCISDPLVVLKLVSDSPVGDGLGAVLALVLGSGVLGYLQANTYFVLCRCFDRLAQSHLSLFTKDKPGFRAIDRSGEAVDVTSHRQSWELVSQYLYSRIETESGGALKGIDNMGGRFINVVHSQGAAAVGVFLSGPIWMTLRGGMLKCGIEGMSRNSLEGSLAIFVLWIAAQAVFWIARDYTIKSVERILSSAIMHQLCLEEDRVDLYYIE